MHKSPHQRIRISTIGALVAVVALATLEMIAQTRVERESLFNARLVNIAGRQRMLSQRVARFAETSAQVAAAHDLQSTLGVLDNESRSLQLLTDSMLAVDSVRLQPVRQLLRNAGIERETMLRLGRVIPEGAIASPEQTLLLVQAADRYLATVNDAVEAAQHFSEAKVQQAMSMARTALIVTVLAALLLAAGVVEPVVRLVKRQHAADAERYADFARLSIAVEQTSNGVLFTDALGRVTWVNEGFSRMTGYSAVEVMEALPGALMRTDGANTATLQRMSDAVLAKIGFHAVVMHHRKNAPDFWLDIDMRPMYDAVGEVYGFLVIAIDISEQVSQRDRLALIFNSVTQGVLLIDVSGKVIESNPAAERILGLTTAELHAVRVGESRWQSVRLDGSPFPVDQLPAGVSLRTGQPQTDVTYGIRLQEGSRKWVTVNSAACRDTQGEVVAVILTFTDVTEALDQRNRMDLVISAAKLGTWDVHVPTGSTTHNANFALMLGYTPSEVPQGSDAFEELLHPDERAAVMQAIGTHLAGKSNEYRMEHRMRRRDGSWAWVIGAGRVTERGPDGEPIHMVGANVDNSATKELESRADAAQLRYDAAVKGTSDGLWTWEVGGEHIWFSPRCWVLLDYVYDVSHPEMSLVTFKDLLHVEDRNRTLQLLDDVIKADVEGDIEVRMRVVSGDYRHFRLRCKAQRDSKKRTTRIAGSIQDIDKQKLAEFKLHRTAMLLEDAQTMARMGSWSYDLRTGQIEWSAQVFALFGRDPSSGPPASGTLYDDFCEEDAGRLKTAIELATSVGVPYSLVLQTQVGHNGVRYVRGEGRARYDQSDKVCGLFGTVADVTSEIERELALKEARAELEDANSRLVKTNHGLAVETVRANDMAQRANLANSAKSEFLANMSHEIRTPLTAILGYADILRDQLQSQPAITEGADAVETIRRAGEHLLIVINDILDLSKIDAGKIAIERIETSLPAVLSDVDSFMRTRAAKKGVALRTTFVNDLPARIYCDPTRLRQILMNLVGNAVKFTDHGTVDVRVGAGGDASPSLCIEIEDTGVGMSPQQMRNLFEPFAQADASVTRRFGGTGLGLTISRRLATLMGGDVRLDYSAPECGSRFVFTLPLVAAAGGERVNNLTFASSVEESHVNAASRTATILSGRILLAEDGEDNQRLISYHLERAGAVVTVAGNGVLALRAIALAEQNLTPFDLLVTDMQMPEMDGYTLARTLRANGSGMPIIALTAHAMAEDRQKCLDAGCDDYATKPVNREAFIATCDTWLRGTAALSLFPAPTLVQSPVSTHSDSNEMLISDFADDADMRELVQSFVVHLRVVYGELETLRVANEWSEIRAIAHQLKGAAGGFGFMPITNAARDFENLAATASGIVRDELFDRLLQQCSAAIRGWGNETFSSSDSPLLATTTDTSRS